ncbi:hypothetical protein [Clostridium hydrogeniformans]|uniref:hypothetical protein n=1 Tax=Clostridium hydrogeniformans TaxID=349933 RepID=UPI000485483B|nr:hypothetical protein [Clostridium hydrogeniformans]
MLGKKEVRDNEIEKLNKDIATLEEEKIHILRKIHFSKWDKLTTVFNNISEYYIILMKLQEEFSHTSIVYEDKLIREEKEIEIKGDIKEVKENMAPYIIERNLLIKEDLTIEEGKKLQEIYLRINYLENQIDMLKHPLGEYINKLNNW